MGRKKKKLALWTAGLHQKDVALTLHQLALQSLLMG